MSFQDSKTHLWLVGAVAVMTLPFLDKALHVDDPVYIYVARQILQNPAQPFGFDINWFGITTDALHSHNHPPLLSYYFSLFLLWFGESEIILHSCLIVFSLTATYSVYFLAQRFSSRPLMATLVVILSPVFFASASTLMLDIPVLACALAATVLFIHGLDNNRTGILVLSGLVLGAACLIKYSAIIQFGVLWFYAFQHEQTNKVWMPLGVAFFIVSGWVFFHFLASGVVHPLLAIELESGLAMSKTQNLIALISYIGVGVFAAGCFSFPDKRWRIVAIGISLTSGLSVASQAVELGMVSRALLFLFIFNGMYLLVLISSNWRNLQVPKDRDTTFLQVWFLIGAAFVVLIIAFNAMRHVLIFLVPLVLLLFRSCPTSTRFERVYPLNLTLAFIISLGVSYGDYKFSRSYREFTHAVYKEATGAVHNPTIWHRTHWGFQYYMEKRGARFLEPSNIHEMRNGDWFVETSNAAHNETPRGIRNFLKPLRLYRAHGSWPFRLMDRPLGAGWYSQWWGLLPFALETITPLETFVIYQVDGIEKGGPS